MKELSERIKEAILEEMDFSREMQDDELRELIARKMKQNEEIRLLSLKEKVEMEQQVFNSLRKLDILQELIEDPRVTEIMVNGPQEIYYERDGKIQKYQRIPCTVHSLLGYSWSAH